MRLGVIVSALGGLLAAAACGERSDTTQPAAAPVPVTVGVAASDELPGLVSGPTGIAFWTHPNVAFNALMIVAGDDGLASYNIEDGNEVSRVPGIAANGVAVSYIGFGPLAAGFAAIFDETAERFRFYGVDNVSRLFIPLPGGPDIRGAVRGFCMGRAAMSPDPTLFVVQKGELLIRNLTPNMDNGDAGVTVNGETTVPVPDNVQACAVDVDGVVILAADNGDIYRLSGDDAFAAPFAQIAGRNIAGVEVLASFPNETMTETPGQIAILDGSTGVIELIDREDGHSLGAVQIEQSGSIEAVMSATAMGASAANFGALYRDGVLAIGVGGDSPAVRLIPANGLTNALDLTPLAPANPRGFAPVAEEENNLFITPVLPGE